MAYLTEVAPGTDLLTSLSRDKGGELQERYRNARPFPHIVIDDFLPPELLEKCLAEFPRRATAESEFNRDQERYKAQFNPDTLTPQLRNIFYSFNSLPFIRLMQNITGIKGLIPDPYFLGAGFHEIGDGGHLSVHADFNHHKPLDLERRINVLIYLNKDWKADYGGQLELWDSEMKNCEVSVVPVFNRCVIFSTTSDSFHGNPRPVAHPAGTTRRSIALYYYSATWDGSRRDHTTQFKARPSSRDKIDWQVKLNELSNDLLPPIVMRQVKRLRNRARQGEEKE